MTGPLQRPHNDDDLDGDMNTSRHQLPDNNKVTGTAAAWGVVVMAVYLYCPTI
jgi:hypothetical protein